MSFEGLHPQLFPTIFDYLTQKELLCIAFLNRMICNKMIEYIAIFQYIPNDNGYVLKSIIKNIISNECVFSIHKLLEYNEINTVYYAYKYNKMINYVQKLKERRCGEFFKGVVAGNNKALIKEAIDLVIKHFGMMAYKPLEAGLARCRTVETFNAINTNVAISTFGLECNACRRNNIEIIKLLSYKDGQCSSCFLSISGHQPRNNTIQFPCMENNKRKIRKYSPDGLTCAFCKRFIENHIAVDYYISDACEQGNIEWITQYYDGKVCGHCKIPVNEHCKGIIKK